MKKIILTIILCIILLLGITGCENIKSKDNKDNYEQIKEIFSFGQILDDGRTIFFTFNVPYIKNEEDPYLSSALSKNELLITDFFKNLNYLEGLKDGGSKLYVYNPMRRTFGDEQFYVISCDSMDGIKDIYVAKNKESLNDKCSLKIDDLNDVSMSIEEGRFTNTGATVIITDTSDRENIYGEDFKLEKEINGVWAKLEPKNDLFFNDIGYTVGDDKKLKLNINWEYAYGKLDSGKYRILKSTSEPVEGTMHYITAEFIIK